MKTEKKNQKGLVIERLIDAPRELVWRAWTVPESLMLWWGPKDFTSPFCKMDLKVGGRYHFCMQGPDGQKIWSTGVYHEIVPNERLVWTDSFADENGNVASAQDYGMPAEIPIEMKVTVLLESAGNKTKLTIIHEGLPEGELHEMTIIGWNQSIDKLVASLK